MRLAGALSWLDSRSHGFAALCLAAMTLLLYYDALSGWWSYDDPLHLKEAILHSPAEYFFVPKVWQEFMVGYFTPLLTLSYDIDYSLFGLDPSRFFAHQLASIAGAAFAFYLLLTLWVPRVYALAAALLLLASTPIALASAWLSVRHYVDGLALASLALYLWVLALRRGKPAFLCASAVLYLLAMLAKEVYVPLVSLMLLMPEAAWRDRLRASLSLWGVLALFLLWRFWMLGGHIGSFGVLTSYWQEEPGLVLLAVMLIPATLLLKLTGVNGFLPLWIGMMTTAAVVARHRGELAKRLGFVAAMLALICVPLVPVVNDVFLGYAVSTRFVMVPAAAVIAALAMWLARLGTNARSQAIGLLVLSVLGVGLGWQSASMLRAWHDPAVQRQEGKFLLERPALGNAVSVSFHSMDFFYRGMAWLRGQTGGDQAPPAAFRGFFGLSPGYDARSLAQRIYRYDQKCDCLLDDTSRVLHERESIVRRMADRPLRVDARWGRGWLAWSLGPYAEGKYFFLAGQQSDWYSSYRAVARRDSLAYLMQGYMRVGYLSPQGWLTFSPEFHVDLAGFGGFEWGAEQ